MYSGEVFKANMFKPLEVMNLILGGKEVEKEGEVKPIEVGPVVEP